MSKQQISLKPSAIFIVEQPWWPLNEKPCQESVQPYLNGLTKRVDCESYYSSFFDLNSLRHSLNHLSDAAVNHEGSPVYLYMAGHASGRRMGSGEVRSINISSLAVEIKIFAEQVKKQGSYLEGVIIGSCELGRNEFDWMATLQGSSIRWILGYKYTVNWFASTQVDLTVLHASLSKLIEVNKDKEQMLSCFKDALSLFNPEFEIHHGDNPPAMHSLSETIMIVGQPAGRGWSPAVWTGDDIWPR